MLLPFVFLGWALLRPTFALDAWHLDQAVVLVNEQLDPVVNPNAQSTHMHKVLGGSGFGASYNFETYRSAKCSSLKVQADKSAYWMPNLYFKNPSTGKFASVPVNPRFYYFLGRNSPTEPVQAFPEGLRMLIGDPMSKKPTDKALFQCQVNSDFSGSMDSDNFNFDRDCPWGMKTEIFFPPCWDGVNLYKTDGSHMSYPVNSLNAGGCPVSHPVRLPAIMLEYTWLTSTVVPNVKLAGNVFWANGDSTGFGVHADFVNGWDIDVLNRALVDTRCAIGSDNAITMTDCPVFQPYLVSQQEMQNCKPDAGVLREPSGNDDLIWLDAIPGCNLPWGANGPKPTCSSPPPQLDMRGLTGRDGPLVADPSKQYKLPVATTPGWKEIMCGHDITALLGGVNYDDPKLTPERCQASCIKAGYSFAGVGQVGKGNFVCQCGTSINTSEYISPGSCTDPCPGDASKQCGASYLFNIYQAGPGTATGASTTPDGSTTLGCYRLPDDKSKGLQASAKYSFQSSVMTRDLCIKACKEIGSNWAYTQSYNTCACGNHWNLAPGSLLPEDFCPLDCAGQPGQKCGDYYRAVVYNISSSTIANAPSTQIEGLAGCYTSNSFITGNAFYYNSDSMTTGLCRRTCRSRGFAYAGLASGNECFCSTSLPNSAELVGSAVCNWACKGAAQGSSNEICGGENRRAISIFDTKGAGAQTPAGYPPNYVGCVNDGTPRQLPGHSFASNSLTSVMCRDVCASFGYAVYGTQYSSQCYCGSTFGDRGLIADTQCSAGCSGNSGERCGAGWILSLYDARQAAVSPSPSPSPSPTTSPSSTPTPSPSPSPSAITPSVPGCYTSTSRDIASVLITSTSAMSPSTCRLWCGVSGYTYSMMINGDSCGCRNNLGTSVLTAVAASQCSTACTGAIKSFCGGASAGQNNVWSVAQSLPKGGICARHEARRLGQGDHMLDDDL